MANIISFLHTHIHSKLLKVHVPITRPLVT